MPQRSNAFQALVAEVHRHFADDAEVIESAMLEHRQSGMRREVDVIVRGRVAGQPLVLAIEATRSKVGAPQAEALLRKHEHLDTDKLVIVTENGFTPQAEQLIAAAGAEAVVLIEGHQRKTLDHILDVVADGARNFRWQTSNVRLTSRNREGQSIERDAVKRNATVYDVQGRPWGVVNSVVDLVLDLHLRDLREVAMNVYASGGVSAIARVSLGVARTGEQPPGWLLWRGSLLQPAYVRFEAGFEVVDRFETDVVVYLPVDAPPPQRTSLGPIDVAHSTVTAGNVTVLRVFTEADGVTRESLRSLTPQPDDGRRAKPRTTLSV